jgi:Ca2+:H+ antiporter
MGKGKKGGRGGGGGADTTSDEPMESQQSETIPALSGSDVVASANGTGDEGAAQRRHDEPTTTADATPAPVETKQRESPPPKRDTPPQQPTKPQRVPTVTVVDPTPTRRTNYGSTADVTPTPARDPGATQAPPPTPATAYRDRDVTEMRHASGAIVSRSGAYEGGGDKNTDKSPPRYQMDYSVRTMVRKTFCDKWQLKLLLIAVPIAIFGSWTHVSGSILFFAAFFGLIPLAAMLGDFTEDLALRSNDVVGALINVTFGNATELIISIMALRAGMFDVIKLSLIGSVLGNMLLVLGTAFVVGGTKYKDMRFNSDAVNTYGPLLMLSMLGFVIPSAYWATTKHDPVTGSPKDHTTSKSGKVDSVSNHDSEVILAVSRQLAVVMFMAYAAYLYFQLVTHKHLFDAQQVSSIAKVSTDVPLQLEDEDEEEEDEELPHFTFAFGMVGLAIASILISMLSDILVETLSVAADEWHLPKQFIGIILVPIVGNAAEHASAIIMASRGKLDIAVGVALGSSIQIAMFVMPMLVLVGWVVGAPLNMDFHPFLTMTTAVSVLVVQNITTDGKTNWLEGTLLICAYLMMALMFWNGTVDMD